MSGIPSHLESILRKSCSYYEHRQHGEYFCSLEDYCLNLNNLWEGQNTLICEGDIAENHTLSYEGLAEVCFDPGTSWLGVNYTVCYVKSEAQTSNIVDPVKSVSQYEFTEGFDLVYMFEAVYCSNSSEPRYCSCSATFNEIQCNSCTLCNDGITADDIIWADIDCSNIQEGLTGNCDMESTYYGEFLEHIELALLARR